MQDKGSDRSCCLLHSHCLHGHQPLLVLLVASGAPATTTNTPQLQHATPASLTPHPLPPFPPPAPQVSSPHPPNFCILVLSHAAANSGLSEFGMVRLQEHLSALSQSLSACDRILNTPIPLSYTVRWVWGSADQDWYTPGQSHEASSVLQTHSSPITSHQPLVEMGCGLS